MNNILAIVTAIAIIVIILLLIANTIHKNQLVKLFRDNSVLVAGARGRGKDMLFNYIVKRRRKSYISNVQYNKAQEGNEETKAKEKKWIPFDATKQWDVGGNTNKDFIEGTIKGYEYPYDDGIDYYISDVGVYFPAQEFATLNKKYKGATVFQALARHLGDCNIHANVQSFNRAWDKMREQFEAFILMKKTKVILGCIVVQRLIIYDRYETAEKGVEPFIRGITPTARREYAKFKAENGNVKKMTVMYFKGKGYDTRRFKTMLKEVKNHENQEVEGHEQEGTC